MVVSERYTSFTSFLGPLYEKLILRLPVSVVHVESRKVERSTEGDKSTCQIVLVYNGVEIEDNLDARYELQYDKFVLYIGRLVAGKNLQTVILAFKKVVSMLPDAKLIVMGDGPLRQEWQELVDSNNLGKNVFFLGHISNRKNKYELLAKAARQ